jgi:hypothetical protein
MGQISMRSFVELHDKVRTKVAVLVVERRLETTMRKSHEIAGVHLTRSCLRVNV